MPLAQLLPAFNSGEISPMLDARVDLDKYQSGCRELQNYITTPYGPNIRRPGTQYLGSTKDDGVARLVPFVFNTTFRYQLEIGDNYMRFWDAGVDVGAATLVPYGTLNAWATATVYAVGDLVVESATNYVCTVAHTSGVFATDLAAGKWQLAPYQEVVTPWADDELADIQYVQINDIAYFVHPLYPPFRLQRGLLNGDILFSGSKAPFMWPALLEQNAYLGSSGSSIYIDPTATTGNIFLVRSGSPEGGVIFFPEQVGGYFEISHPRTDTSTPLVLTANGTATLANGLIGSWQIFTYGTWTGILNLERSYDGGSTWSVIRSYASAGNRNIAVAGNENIDCLLRLKYVGTGSAGANAVLQLDDPIYHGLVRITAYIDEVTVSATVIRTLYSTSATDLWSEGAWSDHQGFPRGIEIHENRVIYGSTERKPLSVWGTRIDDYQNFHLGVNGSDGIFFTIASQNQSSIQWLKSKDGFLHVGLESGEGRLSSSDPNAAISPEDIQWTTTTSYGSKHMQAVILSDALLFVQGHGRKVRSLAQVPQTAAFSASDVTILSEHITRGGIVEFASQNLPEAILWCIRADGTLLGMSYDSMSSVIAWHRHTTQGLFESVSCVTGEFGDEVWFIVNRTIDGDTKRYVERFQVDWRQRLEEEDKPFWVYLDCSRRAPAIDPTTIWTGLDFLDGETVRVLADGSDAGSYVVSEGSVTINYPASVTVIGLDYNSILRPMKLNAALRNGTSQGRKGRIDRVVLRLLSSLGGKYSTDGVNYSSIKFRTAQDNMGQSPPAFTGDTEDLVDRGNHKKEIQIWIKQDAPMPLTILSIVAKWTPSDD